MDRFNRLSSVSRFPPPPVILFKDYDWEGDDQPSKLWIPDHKTFMFLYPKEVTWFFENIEDYTAAPYVAEIPQVDYKGYTDYESKRIMYDAFYLHGVQLVEGDIEFMRQESWSIMKLVDKLVQRETNGADSIYTRVFDHMQTVRSTGLMFLPFLYGSGISAKLGYTPRDPKEQLPVYPGPPPPAYVEVETEHVVYVGLTDSDGTDVKKEQDEPVRDEPPSYEEAVLVCARCGSTSAEVPAEDGEAQDVSENGMPPEPVERQSRKRRLLRRVWNFFAWY